MNAMSAIAAMSAMAAWLPRRTGSLAFWANQAFDALDAVRSRSLPWPAHRSGSRAAQAAEVRERARGYMETDPSFASDLLAAADRHEALSSVEEQP